MNKQWVFATLEYKMTSNDENRLNTFREIVPKLYSAVQLKALGECREIRVKPMLRLTEIGQ